MRHYENPQNSCASVERAGPKTNNPEVITSGLAGGFPRGLPIGRITKIERREAELFLSAEIEPFSDFTKLEEVLVITKPRDTTSLPANPFPLRPPSLDKRESGEPR